MSMLPCVDEISCLNLHPLKSGPPTLPLVQREFRTNEGSTDYATIPEVTLAGDFVIEFDSLGGIDTYGRLLGNTASFDNEVRLNNNNTSLNMKFSGGASRIINFDTVIDRNEFNRFKISRVSSVVTLTINGTIQSWTITDAAPLVLDVMHKSDITYNSGILANLKIYDNGTLVRDYPINDGKNILANVATALGSEIDGLTYALTTAIGGVASVVLSSLSVIGKTYLVEVSYSGVVGDASVRIGGFSGPSFTGTGTIEFVATATTTVNDILGALTGVTSGSVTVSIKEAEGYGTIINGNDDDWGLFDKQANGDWLGQELVVQPINLLNDWANVGGGLIQTASTWNTSATGGIRIASPSWVGGVSVRINAEVYANSSDISVKDSATGQGADPTIATITANTQMSAEVDYVTMNGGLYLRSTGETEGNELFSLSVKEVLKNA